jgi:hypothetical protein
LVIIFVTKDNKIKCKGVCTSVQSLGSDNKLSCNAIIKPYVTSKSPLEPPPVPSSFKKKDKKSETHEKAKIILWKLVFKKIFICFL